MVPNAAQIAANRQLVSAIIRVIALVVVLVVVLPSLISTFVVVGQAYILLPAGVSQPYMGTNSVLSFLEWFAVEIVVSVFCVVLFLNANGIARKLVRIPKSVRCPQCRYRLSGLTTPRCPECGLTLTADFLDPASAAGPGRSEGIET